MKSRLSNLLLHITLGLGVLCAALSGCAGWP